MAPLGALQPLNSPADGAELPACAPHAADAACGALTAGRACGPGLAGSKGRPGTWWWLLRAAAGDGAARRILLKAALLNSGELQPQLRFRAAPSATARSCAARRRQAARGRRCLRRTHTQTPPYVMKARSTQKGRSPVMQHLSMIQAAGMPLMAQASAIEASGRAPRLPRQQLQQVVGPQPNPNACGGPLAQPSHLCLLLAPLGQRGGRPVPKTHKRNPQHRR